jgi:amino-acid N-acetyltransferase
VITAAADQIDIRRARTGDVGQIRELVDHYSPDRRLLAKESVTLYEDVQDFVVAQQGDRIVGCGALHVMWDDLAEVRTIAVLPELLRRGIGGAMLRELVTHAEQLGISKIFCLTFEVDFFRAHGFEELHGPGVQPEVFEELLKSGDEGVAEFLDLERVRPNTLGNQRMILRLLGEIES